MSLDNDKEEIESFDKKTSHSLPEKPKQRSNKSCNMHISEALNTSIEEEHLNDFSLSYRGYARAQ